MIGALPTQDRVQAPISQYQKVQLEDFTGLVSPTAKSDPTLLRDTLELLRFRLRQLKKEIPAPAYRKLTRVRFWIELNDPRTPAAVYHPDAGWLKEHGYDTEMAGNIEIGKMKNFLKWQHIQPSMVLHELSHAYQFQVLGEDNPAISKAFENAVQGRRYESVPFVTGGLQRAYALTNRFEYFAECSEAYFGRNDFYPYLRADFKSFDPIGFAAVEQVWGIGKNNRK
jgi:hypothetical protein